MTSKERDGPGRPASRLRRATPYARQALRLTARTASGVFGLAKTLRALREPRPAASEVGFPDVQLRPAAQFVESIYQRSSGAGARVVAVIGIETGVGTSVCARALAERSALAPSRTLLVDASENRQASAPMADPEPDNMGWFRLTDGEEEPFRLRSPGFLRSLWTEAHKDWETIVIDCGPAIEDREYAVPGRLVARSADAVILVCLAGRSTKETISAAKAALSPANIVGVVVNGRDLPTVGAEIARESQRAARFFPKLSRWLARRALRSKVLDVPA